MLKHRIIRIISKGVDGYKHIKGRKKHLAVDTLGLPIGMAVHKANIYDVVGTELILDDMVGRSERRRSMLADGGYRGDRLKAAAKAKGWNLKVVLRPDEAPKKCQVVPLRWIVERSFSWLENFRRLSIDHEFLSGRVFSSYNTVPTLFLFPESRCASKVKPAVENVFNTMFITALWRRNNVVVVYFTD